MTKIYGIKNCDTMKKAFKWLDANAITYQFHDYRNDGINDALVNEFAEALGWDTVINKRSTTYRNLPDELKNNLSGSDALAVVLEQPTLLKRPILKHDNGYEIGFKEANYQEKLIK